MCEEDHEVYDVFLSHAHIDAEIVEALAIQLEDNAGLRVWLDRWILVPGEHWQQEMAKGIDQAKSCAVCIGQNTPTGWFREEIERALNRQVRDPSFRVIPVILPDGNQTVVDDFLELRTWVEFVHGIHDNHALHILVSGIRGFPPGRGPILAEPNNPSLDRAREQLLRIRTLRLESLIDDDIALEYQRRLLDVLIEL